MPDPALSRRPSGTDNSEKEIPESEAQSRGFYASSRPQASDALRIGGYEVKRRQSDMDNDRSLKRPRGHDDDNDDRDRPTNRLRNAKEENEPVNASDKGNPAVQRYMCTNHMCMGDHREEECDKPRACWGCRSISHYWSCCPHTCTICGHEHHIAKYCEDFELTPTRKSRPRACKPPTEPASHRKLRESLEHAHKEDSLPMRPPKADYPDRAPEKATNPAGQRDRYIPSYSDSQRVPQYSPRSTDTGASLYPWTKPIISPLDPRGRNSSLTSLVSPLQISQMSLEPGEIPSGDRQREAYVPLASSLRNEDVSQAPSRKYDLHSPTLTRDEGQPSRAPSQVHDHPEAHALNEGHQTQASSPNEPTADDSLDIVDAGLKAFEEEDRVRQKEHEEEFAQRKRQQKKELDHELDEKLKQKKHEREMARRAEFQKLEEEHEKRLAELRRR